MARAMKTLFIAGAIALIAFAAGAPGQAPVRIAAAGEPEAGRGNPEFEYYELAPLVLPIINERGVTQQVSLVVSLELPYGKKSEVQPYEPRLADAYLQDLYGALGAGQAMMQGNLLDVQAVKERLTVVTAKVLGPEKVNSVLLQVVQQRRIQ